MAEPFLADDAVTLYLGDCRELMAALDAESVDAIVTDPPYELNFMGKGWDDSGIAYSVEMWHEALRVLKPGGTVLDPFAGSGTTGEACIVEGFKCVMIEQNSDYVKLIAKRMSRDIQPVLL